MSNEDTLIRGQGFHCKLVLDLKEVKSIRRLCFWNRGWWYSCDTHDGNKIDVHVKESIDLLKLFEEYDGKKN